MFHAFIYQTLYLYSNIIGS